MILHELSQIGLADICSSWIGIIFPGVTVIGPGIIIECTQSADLEIGRGFIGQFSEKVMILVRFHGNIVSIACAFRMIFFSRTSISIVISRIEKTNAVQVAIIILESIVNQKGEFVANNRTFQLHLVVLAQISG